MVQCSSLKPSILGYAGTKDRRAKTSQWFSAKRIDPARIATACRYLKDIHVGNFTFGDTNLKLGMLKGNKWVLLQVYISHITNIGLWDEEWDPWLLD